MQKRISIEKIEWKEEELLLISSPVDLNGSSIKAAERVLVDSDQLAFVYILELVDEYVYLSLSRNIWPELKKVLESHYPVKLIMGEQEIELIGLEMELDELVQNIEGNTNYGDEMVKEVESVFNVLK
ncbi:UPF0738 family protein [Bacillus sp. AK128]